ENSCDAPETAEEGAEDEVSGIDEEDVSGSRDRGVEGGLKFGLEKLPLGGDVLGQRLFGGTGTARVRCHWKPRSFRNTRVCVRPRLSPVSCPMRSAASATVRTGVSLSEALISSAWLASSLTGPTTPQHRRPSRPPSR